MHSYHLEINHPKGWFTGPWDSNLPISIGYANCGIDEPHLHTRISEIYLVARGTADLRVEHETLHLEAGDVVIIEPGEAHTFLSSSSDYFHFVIHTPRTGEAPLAGAEAAQDKVPVPRERILAEDSERRG